MFCCAVDVALYLFQHTSFNGYAFLDGKQILLIFRSTASMNFSRFTSFVSLYLAFALLKSVHTMHPKNKQENKNDHNAWLSAVWVIS